MLIGVKTHLVLLWLMNELLMKMQPIVLKDKNNIKSLLLDLKSQIKKKENEE